ncbi:MAG TPA: 50S ribosomal protein L9, partial [Candidatus Deferrimicrobiaceae bacterium]|nr:50S ribosomal protein L9 [Candidatus Deferrimicrobiaceae bacterium]
MKVILREDVENLGKAGDVVKVAGGYGRNYLIPKQLAVQADVRNLRALEHERRGIEARAKKVRQKVQELGEQL